MRAMFFQWVNEEPPPKPPRLEPPKLPPHPAAAMFLVALGVVGYLVFVSIVARG